MGRCVYNCFERVVFFFGIFILIEGSFFLFLGSIFRKRSLFFSLGKEFFVFEFR